MLKPNQNHRLLRAVLLASLMGSLPAWADVKPMVATGAQHSVALRNDGAVFTWGSDQSGQLGAGVLPFEATPGRISTLSNIKAIAAGSGHSLAVDSSGSLFTWGGNAEGQLGDGSVTNRSTPTQISTLTGVSSACGGSGFSLALRADGTLWAWGDNSTGALGNGSQMSSTVPVQLPDVSGVRAIACGNQHALALRQDGKVLAWGVNSAGELGDGSTVNHDRPTLVIGLDGVTAIAAGNQFSVALKQDGTVWEWGVTLPYNTPQGPPRTTAAQTPGLANIAVIAATVNSFGLVAIQVDGVGWWRWTTGYSPEPQAPVGALRTVMAGYGQGFLLKTDGNVLGFGGGNGFGSLGDGTTVYRDEPGPVVGITNIGAVAAGTWHGLALDRAGNVFSWGLDTGGQLGRARVLSRSLPAFVAGLPVLTQVSAGGDHSMGVDADGNIWVWGANGYGQLGDNTYRDTGTPIKLSSIADVQAVAAGTFYSLALKRDGSVWGWGSTLPGVGDNPAVPSRLHSGAKAIVAGGGHALALNLDGTVWAWGANGSGQLGDGSSVDRRQSVQVQGLSGVIAIAAGTQSSYALKADGTVVAWGQNDRGQLGDGSTDNNRLTPVPVQGLNQVNAFSVGASHALARRNDGSVWGWSWGYDLFGELGDNAVLALSQPAPLVLGVDAVAAVTAGGTVSVLLRQDGSVYTAGRNNMGQLGDATYSQPASFVGVVDEKFADFLDLDTRVANLPLPAGKAVPFFLATFKSGSLSATTLKADIRGTAFAAARATRHDRVSYQVYVVAYVPASQAVPLFVLQPNRTWAALGFPIAAYLSNVALNNPAEFILLQLFDNDNLTAELLVGTSILVGYGIDADEMLRSKRFRTIYTIGR